MKNMPITFIEITATSIKKGGFPIQIAIFSPTEGPCESILIAPPEDAVWCSRAEEHHGFSRERLEGEGCSPEEAVTWLNDRLDGKLALSNYVEPDKQWLASLVSASNAESPYIHLESIWTHMELSSRMEFQRLYGVATAECDGPLSAISSVQLIADLYEKSTS